MNEIIHIKRLADRPEISASVIEHAGGLALFARTVGIESRWSAQVACNWRNRGFPQRAFLEYPALLPLCEAAERRCNAQQVEAA